MRLSKELRFEFKTDNGQQEAFRSPAKASPGRGESISGYRGQARLLSLLEAILGCLKLHLR